MGFYLPDFAEFDRRREAGFSIVPAEEIKRRIAPHVLRFCFAGGRPFTPRELLKVEFMKEGPTLELATAIGHVMQQTKLLHHMAEYVPCQENAYRMLLSLPDDQAKAVMLELGFENVDALVEKIEILPKFRRLFE